MTKKEIIQHVKDSLARATINRNSYKDHASDGSPTYLAAMNKHIGECCALQGLLVQIDNN